MDTTERYLSITFRPMQLDDVARVYEIDTLSFSLPWTERSFRFELTENRNSIAWVAEAVTQDGRLSLAAMTVIWVILDEAHVATIATHPDHRGYGIGKRLLAYGLLEAYKRGARIAYLEVRRSNVIAQNLYYKFGFEVVGERLRYYKDTNEDAVLMTLHQIKPEMMLEFAA